MTVDFRKILVASIDAQLGAEGTHYEPSGLSAEEMVAYLEALLEAGVNDHTEKRVRAEIEKLRTAA